jgi:hypothetical protein
MAITSWSCVSDGSEIVPASSYRRLAKPEGYTFQNRFVGNYLIYGTGSGWGYPTRQAEQSNLFVVEWNRGNSHQLTLPHGVDRIEQMGSDAVIVGTDGENLHFSGVRLGQWPEIVSRYTRKEAGYEIVEGKLDDGRMQELRRVNYAPGRRYVVRGE